MVPLKAVARSAGWTIFDLDPGANAPGFMLAPAPRAGEYTSLKRGENETDLVNGAARNTT